MVDATAGCVWGWLRPSRVDVPDAGQAGCLDGGISHLDGLRIAQEYDPICLALR
jgi:hypothetical protein